MIKVKNYHGDVIELYSVLHGLNHDTCTIIGSIVNALVASAVLVITRNLLTATLSLVCWIIVYNILNKILTIVFRKKYLEVSSIEKLEALIDQACELDRELSYQGYTCEYPEYGQYRHKYIEKYIKALKETYNKQRSKNEKNNNTSGNGITSKISITSKNSITGHNGNKNEYYSDIISNLNTLKDTTKEKYKVNSLIKALYSLQYELNKNTNRIAYLDSGLNVHISEVTNLLLKYDANDADDKQYKDKLVAIVKAITKDINKKIETFRSIECIGSNADLDLLYQEVVGDTCNE